MNIKQGHTLSRKKPYEWYYDGENLTIKRKFRIKDEIRNIEDTFSNHQIDMIMKYIKENEEVYLSNSVADVRDGTAKDGIGKFIYYNLKQDTTFQQSSSQLVSIFYYADILSFTKEKNAMKFSVENSNWKEKLLNFINSSKG